MGNREIRTGKTNRERIRANTVVPRLSKKSGSRVERRKSATDGIGGTELQGFCWLIL